MRITLPRGLAACSVVALAACAGLVPEAPVAGPSAAPGDVALANPGFEEAWIRPDCPPHWGCVVHANPNAFRFFSDEAAPGSGKASLCLEPRGYEPWGFASSTMLDRALAGHRLRFTLRVRVANVTGAGGGVFATVRDGFGKKVAHEQRLVKGTSAWQPLSVEFDVPKDMHDVDVGVILEGRGLVCADDAKLAVLR